MFFLNTTPIHLNAFFSNSVSFFYEEVMGRSGLIAAEFGDIPIKLNCFEWCDSGK